MPKIVPGQWSVPWSDLMLTMFVLFVALYLVERERRDEVWVPTIVEPPVVSARGPATDEAIDLDSARLDAELGAVEGIELTLGTTPRIVLTGDLLFESGTARVLPEIVPLLSRVAEVIRRAPPNLEVIRVSGHTDDRPMRSDRYPSNWELSSARASAVARVLIDEFLLDAERFVVSAHAHHRPRDGSSDPVAHARNRRVEISLSPAEVGIAASR